MDDNTRDFLVTLLRTLKDMQGTIVKVSALASTVGWKDEIIEVVKQLIASIPPP